MPTMTARTFVMMCLVLASLGLARLSSAENLSKQGDSSNRYAIRLPRPILNEELEQIAHTLDLSAEQRAFLQSLYDIDYRPRFDQILRERMPELQQRSSGAGTLFDPTTVRHAATFMDAQEQIRAALELVDEDLFAKLEAVLAEPQRASIDRVRTRRSRACTDPDHREILPANIDLWALVHQLKVTPTDPHELDRVLAEYEREVTPLVIELDTLFRQKGADLLWYLVWQRFDDDDTPLERGSQRRLARSQEFGLLRRGVLADSCRLQLAIVDVNRKYLTMLVDPLVDANAQRTLHSRFLELSYPHVFPDHDDATSIYGALVASDDVPDELKLACQQKWDEYRRHVDAVNEEMCRHFDRAMEDLARYQGIVDHVAARNQLRKLRSQRMELHERFLSFLRGILPEESTVLRNRLSDSMAHLSARKSWATSDAYPGW